MQHQTIAGLGLKNGKREIIYLCLLKFYEESKRWFLASLLTLREDDEKNCDDTMRAWFKKYELNALVVDIPQTRPPCQTCTLACPGAKYCVNTDVVRAREEIKSILDLDRKKYEENPKAYENLRERDSIFDFKKDFFEARDILSSSLRKKLKKGFLPYWNRAIDVWAWNYYFDHMTELFNTSYDSMSQMSVILLSRFEYLRRHFPGNFSIYESNINIVLLELLRAKIITRADIEGLGNLEDTRPARASIVRSIEEKLRIFIYKEDADLLSQIPFAFHSFLLSLAGQNLNLGLSHKLPAWVKEERESFIAPSFI